MNQRGLATLEKRLITFLQREYENQGGLKLAEQAVPSYVHRNPVVSYTFWRRLRIATAMCRDGRKVGDLLDFGAGTGVLIPFLHESPAQKIAAIEAEPHARQIISRVAAEFSVPIRVLATVSDVATESIDTVTALDVLEHIENPNEVLGELRRVMRKGALLVVSSPTESALYRFARRFGGSEYSGHYHVSNAARVEAELAKYFEVKLAARLFRGLEFFRIVECRKI